MFFSPQNDAKITGSGKWKENQLQVACLKYNVHWRGINNVLRHNYSGADIKNCLLTPLIAN